MKKEELKTGMYVKLINGSICIVQRQNDLLVDVKDGTYTHLSYYNDDLTMRIGLNSLEVVVVYEDYKMDVVLWERPKDLLTIEEKEYLKFVIKPFKDKIVGIVKLIDSLEINLEDIDVMVLPYYDNLRLYFNKLEYDKSYTLKELGLDE